MSNNFKNESAGHKASRKEQDRVPSKKKISKNAEYMQKWHDANRIKANDNNRSSAARNFVYKASAPDYADLKNIVINLQKHTLTEIPRIHNDIDDAVLADLHIAKNSYTYYRSQALAYLDVIKNDEDALADYYTEFARRDAGLPRIRKTPGPKKKGENDTESND